MHRVFESADCNLRNLTKILKKGNKMATSVIISGACGRMGKTLVELVLANDEFELVGLLEHADYAHLVPKYDCLVSSKAEEMFSKLGGAVVIDFTSPESSLSMAKLAAEHGVLMVIGTTGFTEEQKAELANYAKRTPIFWAPNMSIGVNVLLKVLPELTQMLGEDYDIDMVELHHNKKKDSPSGTALKLAECLAEARNWDLGEVACYHREGIIGERPKKELGIQTIRGGDIVGVHTMYFMGAGERIEVTHQAHSRETFAQGALRAAKWLVNQNAGVVYNMQNIF